MKASKKITPPRPYPRLPFSAFESSEKDAQGNTEYQHGEVHIGSWHFDFDIKGVKWSQNEGLNFTTESISPYIPSEKIIQLIRLAQLLKRPILIKGEPGSGKTQLAKAIAYEWYGQEFEKHFFPWYIKSNSKAADGIYNFDHIARLRDAQMKKEKNEKTYRNFGPLAKAFLTSTPEAPSILLIDEIDKADMDFPNDLLLELDEKRFSIPETNESFVVPKEASPLILITSNDERELPEAFLRRCLFMYIQFPNDDDLKRIIRAHLPDLMTKHEEFVNLAIKRFKKLREDQDKDPNDSKRVSSSELLDWLRAFEYDRKRIFKKGTNLEELLDDLPIYYQALLKTLGALKREKKNQANG